MYQYLPDLLSAQRGAFFNFLQEGLLKSVKSGLKSFKNVNGTPLQNTSKVHMRARRGKWVRINTQKGSSSSFAHRRGHRKPSLVRNDGRKLPLTRANRKGHFFPSFTNTPIRNWPCLQVPDSLAWGGNLSIKLKKPIYSAEEALKYSCTYETEMYASMQFAAFSSTYESNKGGGNVSQHQYNKGGYRTTGLGHTNQKASIAPWSDGWEGLRKTSFYTNYAHRQWRRNHGWHSMPLGKKTRQSDESSQLPSLPSKAPDTSDETWEPWYDATIERNKGGKAKCKWMPLLWCLPKEKEGHLVRQPSLVMQPGMAQTPKGGSKPGYGQNAIATIDRNHRQQGGSIENSRLLSASLQYEIPTTKAYISLGCFPMLTDEGSFIINGAKRMVMNQIIRSPSIYCKMQFRSRNSRTYTISYVSDRGVWLRIERDRSSYIWIRINNYQKIPLFVFLRALGITDDIVMASFEDTSSLWPSLKVGHPSDRKRALQYLGWVFRKGKKPLSVKQTRLFLYEKLFHPRFYDFTNAGRLSINKKFNHQFQSPTLSPEDILLGLSALLHLEKGEVPVDSIDHLKNKRVRLVHELLQNQVRRGFKRLEEDVNIAPRDQNQSRNQAQTPVESNDTTAPKSKTETRCASIRSKGESATPLITASSLLHGHNQLRSPRAHNSSAHPYGATANVLGRWGGANGSLHKAKAPGYDRCVQSMQYLMNGGDGTRTQRTKEIPHRYETLDLFSKPNFSVFALDTQFSSTSPLNTPKGSKLDTQSVPSIASSSADDQRRSLQPIGKDQSGRQFQGEKPCNAVIQKTSSLKVYQSDGKTHAFWSPNRCNSMSNCNSLQYDRTELTPNKNRLRTISSSASMVMAVNPKVLHEEIERLYSPSTSAIDRLSATSFSQTSVHSTRVRMDHPVCGKIVPRNKRWYKKATQPAMVTSSFITNAPVWQKVERRMNGKTFANRPSGELRYGQWQKPMQSIRERNHTGRSGIKRKAKSYARNKIDRGSHRNTLPLQRNSNRNERMAVIAFNSSRLKTIVIDDGPFSCSKASQSVGATETRRNTPCGVSALQHNFGSFGTHNDLCVYERMQHQISTCDKVGVKLKTHPLYGAYEPNAGVSGTPKVTPTYASGEERSEHTWQWHKTPSTFRKADFACVVCAYVRGIDDGQNNHCFSQLPESQAQDTKIGNEFKGKQGKDLQSIGRTSYCFLYEAFATPLSSSLCETAIDGSGAQRNTSDLHCYASIPLRLDHFYTPVNAHKSVLSHLGIKRLYLYVSVSPSHRLRYSPPRAQSEDVAADKGDDCNGLHPYPKVTTPPEHKPCHTFTPGYALRRSSDKPCWILGPDCDTPKKDENLNSYFSKLQKPISKTLKEFFGLNPLSQFMDEINPLGELTQKRRLTSLGPGGVTREAGLAVRDIHPSYYGRICPIETPEGKNAGLVNSLSTHSRINAFGFLETGYLAPSSMKSIHMEWGRLYHCHWHASNGDNTPSSLQLRLPLHQTSTKPWQPELTQGESKSKAKTVCNDERSMATTLHREIATHHSDWSESWVDTPALENWKWMKRFTWLSPEQEEAFYIRPISSATTEKDRWLYHDPEINRQSRSEAYSHRRSLNCFQSTEAPSPEGLHQATEGPKALKANKESVADTRITCRYNQSVLNVSPFNIDFASVSVTSIISVATSLIPFLEHDDGNRALMGSNMQRQGVPLFFSEKPIVATGMESQSARDSRAAITSKSSGRVSFSDCGTIEICHKSYTKYHLPLFQRTNQNTLLCAKPIVQKGDYVRQGDLIADTSSTKGGELSIGANLYLGYMPWEGYNFEDAIVLNQRLVSQHRLTSIHIEKVKITTENDEVFFAPAEKNKERGRINAGGVESNTTSSIAVDPPGTTDTQVSYVQGSSNAQPSPSATSVFFRSQTDMCEHMFGDESWAMGNLMQKAESPVEMLSLLQQYQRNGDCESTITAAWFPHSQ